MDDPIHQFTIIKIFPVAKIGGQDIFFTNSAAYMALAVIVTAVLMLGTTAGRRLVPNRLQSLAELSYEFVASAIRSTAGEEGMKFFPLVFSLFMFILVTNLVGLVPYTFTPASHIIVTASLALLVFCTVLVLGFWNHGLHFLKLFVPSGIPIYILPLIVFIEVLSFLSRPVSHSVRLFANMLAGHITLKVFAGFVTMLGGFGIAHGLGGIGIASWLGAVLPLGLTVALTALELLVAFLQAYVFAILTCIYLNDTLHPGH
jgi:F-type H+-transporting ATPase subunit a